MRYDPGAQICLRRMLLVVILPAMIDTVLRIIYVAAGQWLTYD